MRSVIALSQTALATGPVARVFGRECFGVSHDGDATMPRTRNRTFAAVDWLGEFPARSPGNEGQSLFSSPRRRWNAGRDQKSPIRRCFKSRPPLRAGCAGSPPAASHGCKGCRDLQRHLLREMLAACFVLVDVATLGSSIPWRLSGLLSGYLPTDTRPQARAKLGKCRNKRFESASQHFF